MANTGGNSSQFAMRQQLPRLELPIHLTRAHQRPLTLKVVGQQLAGARLANRARGTLMPVQHTPTTAALSFSQVYTWCHPGTLLADIVQGLNLGRSANN
jgi:hypothetical protein